MARTTMQALISRMRMLTAAGTAEYTVAGVTFFSDDQVQDVLDRNRRDLWNAQLTPVSRPIGGGSVGYFDYALPSYGDMEATSGGTSVFVVRDGIGTVQGTALWSADYQRGIVTFADNQAGSARYLDARTYDIHAAAADLLESWAAAMALQFDFTTDDQTFKRSQKHAALLKQAGMFRAMAGPQVAPLVRNDLNGYRWK